MIYAAGGGDLADKAGVPVVRTITGMTAQEKCSWVMKTTKDAPTFKITTSDGTFADNYYLHYIEYDNVNGVLYSPSGTPTAWLSGTDKSETNTVKATYYKPDNGFLG
jgi:hypothetical protein